MWAAKKKKNSFHFSSLWCCFDNYDVKRLSQHQKLILEWAVSAELLISSFISLPTSFAALNFYSYFFIMSFYCFQHQFISHFKILSSLDASSMFSENSSDFFNFYYLICVRVLSYRKIRLMAFAVCFFCEDFFVCSFSSKAL